MKECVRAADFETELKNTIQLYPTELMTETSSLEWA